VLRKPHDHSSTLKRFTFNTMKTNHLLAAVLGCATIFTGCEYDDDDYATRHVSVTTETPYYSGDFDEYSPYYSYSGRRYYRTGNRYVYYSERRPYYVASVPTGAVYTTPPRRTVSADYYGDFDEYSPYYAYSGRRYYRTGNRYVYYSGRRPSYVASVPTGAVYTTPSRHTTTTRVVRHHHHDDDDD
jgi:hypothetical protein